MPPSDRHKRAMRQLAPDECWPQGQCPEKNGPQSEFGYGGWNEPAAHFYAKHADHSSSQAPRWAGICMMCREKILGHWTNGAWNGGSQRCTLFGIQSVAIPRMCINKALAFHLICDSRIGEKNEKQQLRVLHAFPRLVRQARRSFLIFIIRKALLSTPLSLSQTNPLLSVLPPLIREDFVLLQAGGVC